MLLFGVRLVSWDSTWLTECRYHLPLKLIFQRRENKMPQVAMGLSVSWPLFGAISSSTHCLALECSLLLYCNSDISSPEMTVYSESEHPSLLMSSLLSLCLSVCWPLDAGSKKSKFHQVPQAFSSWAPLCSGHLCSVALQSTPQQEEAFCICLVSHVPFQAEATSRENISLKRFCNL